VLGFGHANVRAAGAVAALLTFPIGTALSATVQLSALLALLLTVIVIRPRRSIVNPLTDGLRAPSAEEERDPS
jgi:hypothetical protein